MHPCMSVLDRIDSQILSILQHAARTPLSVLAKMVGRSRTAVQARIDRLERDGVIRGYHTILSGDVQNRGIGTIMIVYLNDRMRVMPVIEVLKGAPEVMGVYRITGPADLIVTFAHMTRERMQEVCEPIWALPEVKETDTQMVLRAFIESTG